jgi:tRNA threonylcarbamoyl adenosine modification protein YeaZ
MTTAVVLALDTSSAAIVTGIGSVDSDIQILAQRCTVNARAHGELLAPSISACLADAGVTVDELDAVVAGVGPGPFTGLRVGLVTAAAFGDALSIPTYGVCSLDAIAVGLDEPSLLVATDARRREVYWARYVAGRRVAGPAVSRPADIEPGDVAAMAGAGARLYADVLGLPLRNADYPTPRALVGLAADRTIGHAPSEPLTPLYLRRPDVAAPHAPKAVL